MIRGSCINGCCAISIGRQSEIDMVETLLRPYADQIDDLRSYRDFEINVVADKSVSKKGRARARQTVVSFESRSGSVERFAVWQTFPDPGPGNFVPATQAQYEAVANFFQFCTENAFQAGMLLSARDYAINIAQRLKYDNGTKDLLTVATAAFILSEKEIRQLVRSHSLSLRSTSFIFRQKPVYRRAEKRVLKFVEDAVDNLRRDGSFAFG
jgi:hypothetical protein